MHVYIFSGETFPFRSRRDSRHRDTRSIYSDGAKDEYGRYI